MLDLHNLYNLINQNSIIIIFWVLLTIVFFIIYRNYLPKPSTLKSMLFSVLISLIISIYVINFRLFFLFPSFDLEDDYLISDLLVSVITALILSLINHIYIKNGKILIKIGIFTIVIIFFSIISPYFIP